jgi:hypothetical protein
LGISTIAPSIIEAVAVLDSLKSSDQITTAAGKQSPHPFDDRNRSRGHRGGVIAMHRALARFVLEPLDLALSVLLVLLFSFVWLVCLPWVCRFWQYIFENATKMLALGIGVGLREYRFTSYVRWIVPYPRTEDVGPDARTWWLTAAAVLVLFFGSLVLPRKWLPVTYLLRGTLLVQAIALLYFALAPGRFPHTPDSYMEGLVTYGIVLISFVPILYGLTYYIFNFGLMRKFLITALTMTHLCLFFPVQVLVQAVILEKSVLFMPMLYVVFGMPLDVLLIIAFYGWGMSWLAKTQNTL